MKQAKKSDWETSQLPPAQATVQLDRVFTAGQMLYIRQGFLPRAQEDKWFIYWENDALFFHRSWTGSCIYVVRFAAEGDGVRMISADVNRDQEQYGETDDHRDMAMISYLIDVLLLHQHAEFPSDESSPEMRAVQNWSQVGRAMFGEGPEENGSS